MPVKRSLRLPMKETDVSENRTDDNPPKRRSTRLNQKASGLPVQYIESPEKVEKEDLPFISYSGAIKYYTDAPHIAEQSDQLMQWVEQQTHLKVVPIAFDMEWPFSFQTGSGKSAVIQLCAQEDCCYVFQLTNLKKLPPALLALLRHTKVRLHGVNIKNDFRKLARDFPTVDADDLISRCVDLGVWNNQICETGGRWSLERLVNTVLELAIDKSKKVRMSQWHVIPLDQKQLTYAAIDVYIGQVLYRELEKLEQTKHKNEEEYVAKNGKEAFKVAKSLGETFLEENNAE